MPEPSEQLDAPDVGASVRALAMLVATAADDLYELTVDEPITPAGDLQGVALALAQAAHSLDFAVRSVTASPPRRRWRDRLRRRRA